MMTLNDSETLRKLTDAGFKSGHLEELTIALKPDEAFLLGATPRRSLSNLDVDGASAIALADSNSAPVVLDFADHALVARPGSSLDSIRAEYTKLVRATQEKKAAEGNGETILQISTFAMLDEVAKTFSQRHEAHRPAGSDQSTDLPPSIQYAGLPIVTSDSRLEFLSEHYEGSFRGWTISSSEESLTRDGKDIPRYLQSYSSAKAIRECEYQAYHVRNVSDGSVVRAISLRIVGESLERSGRTGRPPEGFNAYEFEFQASVAPPAPTEAARRALRSDISGGRRTGVIIANCDHKMSGALAEFLVGQIQGGVAVGAAMNAMIDRAKVMRPDAAIISDFGYAENYVLGDQFEDYRQMLR